MICEVVMGILLVAIYAAAIVVFSRYQGRKFKEELRKIKGEL